MELKQVESVDPIDYPKIRLNNGETFEVKFRLGDIIRLRKQDGVDITALQMQGGEAFERTVTLLRAGLAHAQVKYSVEELADLIDLANFTDVVAAVNGAIKKALPQVEKIAETPKPAIQ